MTSLPKNKALNSTVESSTYKEGVYISTTITHEEHIWVDNVSEDQIWTIVHENHFPDPNNLSFSIRDLLSVTGNIIDDAANNSIVDNILQHNAHDTTIYNGKDTFISPLCLLKSISCQMSSCKDGEQVSLPLRTEEIFKKLKTFSWEAKAVLTLAAFALEYGDFWHLAQHYGQCDKLTKSVAILKRVPILIKHETLKKRRAAVAELNNLIMETYHVIGYIVKLEELLRQNNPNDVPRLTTAMKKIPTAVYWTIYTIVACTAEINRLTSDKEEPDNLPKQLSRKINEIHKNLKEDYERCTKAIEETAKYLRISKELVICDNITKVISTLILYNNTEQPVIISRDFNNNKIDGDMFINEVKGKYVLFYISSLENILNEELLLLKKLYKKIDKEYNCKIVWIPIEGDWTTGAEKRKLQFEAWSKQMPWYTVQYFSSPSYMYLKKEWKVRGNSTAVLINPQGKVENTNALTLIKEFEIYFFAFLDIKLHTILKPVVADITKDNDQLLHSMENQRYTFFIGGKNQKTTNDLFSKIIKEKLTIEEQLKIQFELASVTKESETAKTFWFGMENLFFSLAHSSKEYEYKQVTKEVHKLLSYKHKEDIDGWIMLTKGWTVVTCGQANTIFTTLEKFSVWKQHINGEEWENAFTEYHDSLITGKKGLSCITFQIAGNAPMHLDCPVCDDPMETKLVKYNCCHPRLQNAPN